MAARRTIFRKGCYYHLYNRGANKERIFRNEDNYLFLLDRVRKYIKRDAITMIAYCLLPNHYHFLVRQDGEIPLSVTIQSIFNSYSKAFNRQHKRSGTLFEGPFKSVLVDWEEYLIHLCRYIHRNPIEGERPLVKELSNWPYSNYPEWIGTRAGNLVGRNFIKGTFPAEGSYWNFVEEDQLLPEKKARKFGKYLFG